MQVAWANSDGSEIGVSSKLPTVLGIGITRGKVTKSRNRSGKSGNALLEFLGK